MRNRNNLIAWVLNMTEYVVDFFVKAIFWAFMFYVIYESIRLYLEKGAM